MFSLGQLRRLPQLKRAALPGEAALFPANRNGIVLGARAAAGKFDLLRHRQQAFALQLLALQLAGAAHGLGLFAGLLLGGLLVVSAELHLAENPLTLHLLLERLEGLIDVVIADYDLQVLPLQTGLGCQEGLQGPSAWAAD